MAEEIEPTPEEVVEDAQSEEPEVEAHSAEAVLGLQGIEDAQAGIIDDPAAGSCSSCNGSLCS